MLIGRFQQRLPKAMFATALFAFLSFGGSSAFAAPQSVSSDKELSAALKNVKTADDHRHIAAYYQQKAQKLQDKEKREQQLADYFAAHPIDLTLNNAMTSPKKEGVLTGGRSRVGLCVSFGSSPLS